MLFAASLVVGLIVLPRPRCCAAAKMTAIQFLAIQRSANVPTYLLDQPETLEGGRNVVTVGMDVPAGESVDWTLSIWCTRNRTTS